MLVVLMLMRPLPPSSSDSVAWVRTTIPPRFVVVSVVGGLTVIVNCALLVCDGDAGGCSICMVW